MVQSFLSEDVKTDELPIVKYDHILMHTEKHTDIHTYAHVHTSTHKHTHKQNLAKVILW